MTAETLPSLTIVNGMETTSASPRVRVEGDRIVIDRIVIHDRALASFLMERPTDDRLELVERALRIGLLALQDAGVTVNVDVVRV